MAVTLIAAAGWLFSKNALATFPPFIFIALRFCLAAFVLCCLSRHALAALTSSDIKRACATGCVLGATILVWVIGLQRIQSIGEGAFLVSLTIVLVPVVSKLLFADKIPRILILALCPAIAGLAFLTLDNGFQFESAQLYFLAATLGFALHITLSSHLVANIPALPNSAIQLTMTGLFAVIAAFLTESWPETTSVSAWSWVLASAIIATSFRFTLQNRALQSLKPSHASMIFILEPVWTALLGASFLGERLTFFQIIGCALIFTSLVVFRWRMVSQFLGRT